MTQTTPSAPTKANSGPVGPLMALLGFALYATHDVLIRILGETYSVFQIMFYMGLFSFPFLVLMLIRDPEPGTLRAVHPWWSLTRTACVVVSAGGAFYAFTVLPLAQVYAVLFASPLLITLLSIPMLGEKVGLHRGGAVIVGLLGVIVVLRPGGTELGLGHAAALLSASTAALNGVIVRKIGPDERSAVLLLYPMLANVVIMGALLPAVYVPMELPHLATVVVIAALAFVAMSLSIGAYKRSEAALVAPMQYSQILWAAFYGAILFGESPDRWTVAGASLIVASGLYIVFRESRRNVSENQPVLQTRLRNESVAAPAPIVMEELQQDLAQDAETGESEKAA
ncbi:DMT family transporter [Pararhodobacter sp. CCB-MM2]|uniref:DMT family transporter n=1 Tax=Pararhodobacter sp. CCB-MM2 TaxID=1786003 RepID=UPI00082D535F|nr:DMT family transporter [Pararhodobacter sp. CCB-MM2]MCA2012467.1 DMT family transporter [Cereibacter sphaeroides]